ncbi:MAG: hypothetical protein U1E86_28430 [Burkholderiaceae bacterium]
MTLSANVNAAAFGTNGPIVRITTSAAPTGQPGGLELGLPTLINTIDGAVDVNFEIQSPISGGVRPHRDHGRPDHDALGRVEAVGRGSGQRQELHHDPGLRADAGTDFTINTVNVVPSVPGALRLEATATLSLTASRAGRVDRRADPRT